MRPDPDSAQIMKWTTSADLRAQVLKLWDKGDLLRPLVSAQPLPPLRLRLNGPASSDLSERFDAVRTWLDALRGTPRVRIVWREFRHACSAKARCRMRFGSTRKTMRWPWLASKRRRIGSPSCCSAARHMTRHCFRRSPPGWPSGP